MEELKFASTNEALQYLADETGQQIIVAGWLGDKWEELGQAMGFTKDSKNLALARKKIKELQLAMKDISKTFNNKDYSHKLMYVKDDRNNKKPSTSSKAIEKFQSKPTFQNMQLLLKVIKSEFGSRSKETEMGEAIGEAADSVFGGVATKAEVALEALEDIKGIEKSDEVRKTTDSADIDKLLNGITSQFKGAFSKALAASEDSSYIAFDSEEEAIQHLSDITNKRIVISE